MKSYNDRFWDNLESLMKEKDKSWRSLAKNLGMADSQIFAEKANRNVPRAERLVTIAKSLDVSMDRLMDV